MQEQKIAMTKKRLGAIFLLMVEKNANPKYPQLAKIVSEAMDKKGVVAADVARAIGVTEEMARRYRVGDAMPREKNLNKLADFLGVSRIELREGAMPDALDIVLGRFDPEAREPMRALIESGKGMTPKQVSELARRALDAKLQNEEAIDHFAARRA